MDPALLGLIGTLAGVIITGVISIALTFLSNRNALDTTRLNLSEERAKWATERQLDRIQKFYGTVQTLIDAVDRMYAAELMGVSRPVEDYNKAAGPARHELFERLSDAKSEISLMDEEIQSKFADATSAIEQWVWHPEDRRKSAEIIGRLSSHLEDFKTWLAERYRQVFDARRTGADVGSMASAPGSPAPPAAK